MEDDVDISTNPFCVSDVIDFLTPTLKTIVQTNKMLIIDNIDKMVGTKMVLHNFYIPSPILEWICEKVIEFPGDGDGLIPLGDASYRFEYKANSDYDVPLCIYLRRTLDETGNYKLENNLMDVNSSVLHSAVQNKKIFEKVLEIYATEVIIKWAKDQNMI